MHRVSGLRKETKKQNNKESIGHVDALDTTELCILEKEEKSYVVAEKPRRLVWFMSTTYSSGVALAENFELCIGHA